MTVVNQETSSGRDKILQRIINLRARADDEASSEAEMFTALTKAMKLMESYNVQEAELAIAEAEGRIEVEIVHRTADTTYMKGTSHKHKVLNVLSAISAATETKHVIKHNGSIVFTGHRPDTELANYLVALIKESLDREFVNYRNSIAGRIGYGAKTSFQVAMASRISSRLYQMVKERNEERNTAKKKAEMLKIENSETASSTALVISEFAEAKHREVNEEFQKAYPKLRQYTTTFRSTNATAHGAGRTAGDHINLGKAIGASAVKQIR